MCWEIKGWISGGYMAAREDGEMVFIYKRPSWGTGQCGMNRFYELRSHGLLIGKITSQRSWQPQVRAEWLANENKNLSEIDLAEITAAINMLN